MKEICFFLLFSISNFQTFSQSCSDAESDLNYAYSHVKSAYDSNNLSHLQYYSKRSFDAFERAKEKLNNCKCEDAYNHAYKGSELLSKLPDAKSFEDGRFYVNRAKDVAQKAIHELNICSKLSYEDEALAELEHERLKLEEQHKLLKQKEVEIKQILAKKSERELRLNKEKLISKNEQVIATSIGAFRDVLSACECSSEISKYDNNNQDLFSKSIEEIKSHYLNSIKRITSNYMSALNNCKI